MKLTPAIFYIVFANAMLFFLSLLDNCRGRIFPDIIEIFQLSGFESSCFFSLTTLFSLLTYLTSRWWLKPLGTVRSAVLGLSFLTVNCLSFYTAIKLHSFSFLMFTAMFFGITTAICSATMNLLIIKGTDETSRVRFLALVHGIYGLASFAAPIIISAIVLLNCSWNNFFLVVFVPVLLLLIFVLNSTIKRPELIGTDASSKIVFGKFPIGEKLAFPLFAGFSCGGEILISSRLPLYLEKCYNFSGHVAGLYLSCFFVFLMCGRFALAFNIIKAKTDAILKVSMGLAILIVLLGFIVHPFFFAVAGGVIGPIFPTAIAKISEMYKANTEQFASYVLASTGICTTVMHYVFGVVTDLKSVEFAFSFSLIYFLIAALILMRVLQSQANQKVN